MIVEIRANGRIHGGLIDLSDSGYRLNGGFGWAIEGLKLVVRVRNSDHVDIADHRTWPLLDDERQALADLVADFGLANGVGPVGVEIRGDLPSHRGLGAGTAIRLAVLEACAAVGGLDLSREALVAASGRGGTSGIGIRTYFDGGLVLDIGHPRDSPAAPSRDRAAAGAAMALMRVDMPRWTMGVAFPKTAGQVSITGERGVFTDTVPIAMGDVQAMLYEAIYGVLGGALEADEAVFARAIDAVQKGTWKQAEWRHHGSDLARLAIGLRSAGAFGVGLSSMGPALYFLHGDKFGCDALRQEAAFYAIFPTNQGRVLRKVIDA
jgi:beta-ribofuranosylaminobenzene 5'-phosphate synthase